ncbi:MAG: hypothetical protein IJS08_09005 [Victivallales bacterium]|nr:hypothetical protein [Victivallales bacterium]
MAYTALAAAVETEHSGNIENRTNWAGDEKYREIETVTFTQPVTDETEYPSSPRNIGNLGSGFKCENRRLACSYGTPLSKLYSETWVKKGEWQNVQ